MASNETVLIAGVGMLGAKIASVLLDKEGVGVRLMVRPGSHRNADEVKKRLTALQDKGATVVEGDLLDPDSLDKAVQGVTRIISAVQGDRDVIVTGQQNLLAAAERAGSVQRFISSDYSLNLFNQAPGDNYNSDLRREFDQQLMQSSVPYTIALNGAFTEVEFSPWGGLFDFQAKTFSYWGDGETLVDVTTTDDTARYVAEAVLDPTFANHILQVAGDVLTMKQLLATYEDFSGQKLEEKQLGSIPQLKEWIEQKKKTAQSLYEYLGQQYHYGMVSGTGKLTELDNDRFPNIKPTTVRQYLESNRANFAQL